MRAAVFALVGLLAGYSLPSLAQESIADGNASSIFSLSVPLGRTGTGSFTVSVEIGGETGEFLLDTGASMVTINRELFDSLRASTVTLPAGKVAARLASGELELLETYDIQSFRIGESCELGPLRVAVMPRGGRNLLGMSALSRAAPFTVYTSPPALGLSGCAGPGLAQR